MKKIFSLFAAVLFAGSMMADVVISGSDFAGQGTASTGSEVSATVEGVTFTCDKAYSDDEHATLRCYKNGNITITAPEKIGKLVFQFYQPSQYSGGLDEEVVVNANEWNYQLPSQARIEQVTVVFGDAPAPQVDTLSAAEALALAQTLEVGATTKAVCKALVASIKTAYSEQYGNITVWLNDDPESTYGDIQAYRASCSAEDGLNLKEHDQVLVVGNLTHTQSSDGSKDYYEFAAGAKLTRLAAQGIENITLTEDAQKVIVDGVVYIVRDGKMFNVQGAQVR